MNTPDLKLRTISPDDVDAVMAVRLSVRENILSRERMAELGINEETLAQMLRTTHWGYCLETDHEMVGFSMAEAAKAKIFALFVRPDWEGRGVGKTLLNATVDRLHTEGHQRLFLTTEPGTRALDFYQRQGWHYQGLDDDGEAALEYRFER